MKTVRKDCTAFSWNMDGQCRGVKIVCTSGGMRVASVWQTRCEANSDSLSESLALGRKELGLTDTSYCLAAPCTGGWGMADLDMPALKGAEMQGALAFELRKCTPLSSEQLVWGYRNLETAVGQEKRVKVRLFYAKKDVWRKWMSIAAGLSHVDLLAPAPVVLDPLLGNRTVVFPGHDGFEYVPSNAGREIVPGTAGKRNMAFKDMLPMDDLDMGELAALPESEQADFIPAIVMAMYGLGRSVAADAATLPSIPQELKPKRYQNCHIVVALLCAVIAISLCYGLMQAAQIRMTRLRLVKKDISAVETELKMLRSSSNSKLNEAAKALEEEMARYRIEAPSLSRVLVELSKLVNPPGWFGGSFTWSMDVSDSVVPVTFVLREPAGSNANLDIGTRLNNSPVLGDVVESKAASNRAGYTERRFVLKARYDTEEEKAALEKERQQRRTQVSAEEDNDDEAGSAGQQDADDADDVSSDE